MLRWRGLIAYGVVALALVVLFAVFIGFKRDAALVGALSAAGQVAAAGFAALAAVAAMRAAAESSSSARRSREALARSVRPRIYPTVGTGDGKLLGSVQCGEGRGAVDVMVVWMMTSGHAVTGRAERLEPWRADLPPGTNIALTVDLGLPDTANVWEDVKMVWIEYGDDGRVGKWQDTWQVGAEPHSRETFVQSDSELAG